MTLLSPPQRPPAVAPWEKKAPLARGGWEEGKLERAGNAGKGKERKETPAFSLFPSSPALPFSLSSAPAPVSSSGVH